MTQPDWKYFEIAVAKFVAALDPNARVSHDVRLPDKDTGRLRQRDVWVEANLLGHYPVNILINCKRKGRKLNEQDIDAFRGELLSSGAHKGVIYSYSGFGQPAIEKARALGICCCRIYSNEPPDIPDVLLLKAFCVTPQLFVTVKEPPPPELGLRTFNDLFKASVETAEGKRSVLDVMMAKYHAVESAAIEKISPGNRFPVAHKCEFALSCAVETPQEVKLIVGVRWKFWRGSIEAHLVDGSYNVTNGEFIGTLGFPWVDTQGASPGPGWEPMSEAPSVEESNVMLCVLSRAQNTKPLQDVLGPVPLISS